MKKLLIFAVSLMGMNAVAQEATTPTYETTLQTGKVYKIVNAFVDTNTGASKWTTGEKVILGSLYGNVTWGAIDTNRATSYWTLEEAEGDSKYYIRNLATGDYIYGGGANNGTYAMNRQKKAYTISPVSGHDTFFKIVDGTGNLDFHTAGHSSGAGASGNLISWGNSTYGSASVWYFESVDDTTAKSLISTTYTTGRLGTNATSTAPGDWVKVNYDWAINAADLGETAAVITNTEASIAEVVNAYYTVYTTLTTPFEGNFFTIKGGVTNKLAYANATGQQPPTESATDVNQGKYVWYIGDDYKIEHLKTGYGLGSQFTTQAASTNAIITRFYPHETSSQYYMVCSSHFAHDNANKINRCSSNGDAASHRWTLTAATEEQLAALAREKEVPTDAQLTAANEKYGEGLGKYHFDQEAWDLAKEAVANDFTIEGYHGLHNNLAPYLKINKPVPGSFIRIKNNTGQKEIIITPSATTINTTANEETDQSIVYYSPDKHLIGWTNGVAAKRNDSGNLTAVTSAAENATLESAANVDFGTVFTSGIYYMKNGPSTNPNQGDSRYTYTNADNLNNGGNFRGELTNGSGGYYFVLSEVTALPVAIHADGFGSVVSPVAFIAPSGCNTYVAKGNGNKIRFEEVDEGGTIPAGAHAFIKTTANTKVYVGIASDDIDPAEAHISLTGSHLIKEYESNDSTNIYAKVEVPQQSGISLADLDEPIKMVKLTPDANGKVTTPAGAAVMSVSSDLYDTDVLELDPESVFTTSISGISADKGMNAIYDLQGRRLATPVRGVNIINGRKVIVK